jgi:hypothetical protein
LINPLNQVIQKFDLLELGSRMQVFEKLSHEEKLNLIKYVGSKIPTALEEEGQSERGSKGVEREISNDLLNHHLTDLTQEIYKQVPSEVLDLVQKIKRKDERLNTLSFKGVAESLNEVLHSIRPVEIKIGDDFDKSFIKKGLMLQKNILEIMNYMHRYGFITTEDFKSFFASKHTIEIAAITMFSSFIPHSMYWISYHTIDYILLVQKLPLYGNYIMKGESEIVFSD